VINLIQTDIGRPIDDIVIKIDYEELIKDAKAVLNDLVYREKEVATKDDQYFLMRMAPYRTTDNVIDGLVITFIDLTNTKKAEAESRRLATILRDSNDAITVMDLKGNILHWNRGAETIYGYSEKEALAMNVRDMIPEKGQNEIKKIFKKAKMGEEMKPFKTKRLAKDGRILDIWMTVTELVDAHGEPIELATTERNLAWLSDEKQEVDA
jgi:two-component system CheB/CheR fusion protein